MFGPLSLNSEPQEKGDKFSFTPRGNKEITLPTPTVNTIKPIFGPLSLNTKPQEKEDKFSFAFPDNRKATTSAPLSLMPIATQALSQAYGEDHDIIATPLETEDSDSMGRWGHRKSRKTPEPSNTAAAAFKPPLTKGSDVTTNPTHRTKATATANSGPPARTIQSAPRATGSSEGSRNAHHSTSTSDELDDRGDESETSSEVPDETDSHRDYHMKLLTRRPEDDDMMGIMSAPIFTNPVLEHVRFLRQGSKSTPFPQYAFLAGNTEEGHGAGVTDPRIFYNVASPSSIFICGQQGSGKSHTLSCLLEGCLMPSKLGRLPHP
ncbi:P-loop containing nucleoside triphosphate hydrolase [Apiospora phragmitis]|uniref:P-loop containing nucleoside triphosphate hydrolase n=1 Tax=Apiospora phragmitis TaxID=2905665 RepID=A0ABR1UQT5_9PEZI